MPEGPEVKILVDKLKRKINNKTMLNIKILNGRYKKKAFSGYQILKHLLPLKVKEILCKGKFIYITFYDTDIILYNTLGMSGTWISENKIYKQQNDGYYGKKHNNIMIVFEDITYYFNDMRNFGTLKVSNKDNLFKILNKLGCDVLNINDESELFLKRITKKSNLNKYICEKLLDQTIVAGCGNYMRAEALYFAKINPFIKIKNINIDDLLNLYYIIKKIAFIFYNINKGIKYKILSKNDSILKTYLSKNYIDFVIYGKKYGPNNELILSEKINGRTIHYIYNK
jgi:DNA-formamidopyrimidine glycosylase